ncbi:nucleoside-diphosphate-sugar epimerase [Zhihengliuella halotolerans]|uniref:Nucleoside-diphosphate-sugar epimerase n=2 Tax=Zhihengliuella halotolerans TaxID=370736 RepID=A0A4Q8AAK7_9MICC|nr:nucleoside-diphosphate-sugar epimerase [Zhihengliuella halotolerans]
MKSTAGRLCVMTVLIAGCGDLGTEAGIRFVAAGHRVIGWRRTPDLLTAAGLEAVAADLTTELPTIPADVSIVVVSIAADRRSPEAYRTAYVDGVRNVLDALERDRVTPKRILLVSSTAVYGDRTGLVDESTPALPASFSGQILLEAEMLLLDRLRGTSTEGVVLRLGGIYGPGRTRLIDMVKEGRAVVPEEPRRTNRIHRDDAAAAIVHLASAAAAPQPLYLGVDDESADLGDVLRFLSREMDCGELPVGPVPVARGGDKRCVNDRLRGTGFRFAFPTYKEGYRSVLAGEGVRHP